MSSQSVAIRIFLSHQIVSDGVNNGVVVIERAQWVMAMGIRETARGRGSFNWCRRERRKLTDDVIT